MRKISIKSEDLGFLTAQPITVQVYEDCGEDVVWCNHAGAEEEVTEDHYGHQRLDEFCDKCEAWRPANIGDKWYDAPSGGER